VDTHQLASIHQRELLADAERDRVVRDARLARRCRAEEEPGAARLMVEAILGRQPRPVSC